MGRIDQETVRQILDTANIVDVVSDFVSLKRRGANYIGLCPFHNERTPSFSVSPARGICKCFSCGKGGSPVNFIMEHEQMTFQEALRYLARKYNIEIRERELTDQERQLESERESLFALNEFALDHFRRNLTDTEDGRDIGVAYFRERGINDEMIRRFYLGYALDRSNALYNAARAKGFEDKYLIKTGLCIENTERHTIYDRFKGRVIYPVHSISGKVVAFGGRTLRSDKQVAKYVNSPESEIYHKSSQLYGLFQAKRSIVEKGKCILVEGYMDVISMHQSGITNVVASSGTSLTEGQIRLIHRFTENVTVIYDSDPAGIKASLRGIDMLLAEGLNIKVLLLPDGEDPDSFAQKHTAAEVEEYIAANETDFIRFKTRILLNDAADDPIRRASVINDVLRSVAAIDDLVKSQVYLAECARNFGVGEESLGLQLARIKAGKAEEVEKRERVRQAVQPDAAQQPRVEADSARDDARELAFLGSFEKRLLRYVVKYAVCDFCDVENDDGSIRVMSVLEFILEEMKLDGIEFSNPLYRRTLQLAVEAAAEWPRLREERALQLRHERDARLEREIAEMRDSGDLTSVSAINAREARIKAECEDAFLKALDLSAEEFVSSSLCSSPDDDVRRLATELTIDRYELSKVHTKHNKVETERESLIRLVPRACYEMKSAVLEVEIHRLQRQIDSTAAVDRDALRRMMELMALRAEFARSLGERTITPIKL